MNAGKKSSTDISKMYVKGVVRKLSRKYGKVARNRAKNFAREVTIKEKGGMQKCFIGLDQKVSKISSRT